VFQTNFRVGFIGGVLQFFLDKKLGTLERAFSSYEIVYTTEHLLSVYNISQLELSRQHIFFFRPLKLTYGRPSDGLVIAVNKKFSCSLFESSDDSDDSHVSKFTSEDNPIDCETLGKVIFPHYFLTIHLLLTQRLDLYFWVILQI